MTLYDCKLIHSKKEIKMIKKTVFNVSKNDDLYCSRSLPLKPLLNKRQILYMKLETIDHKKNLFKIQYLDIVKTTGVPSNPELASIIVTNSFNHHTKLHFAKKLCS